MIVLSNSQQQTLQPNQSLTFDIIRHRSGCAERFRDGSSAVRITKDAMYDISFNANVSSATDATAVQLSLQVGGETLSETTMISTPATANTFNNISASTVFRSGCCSNISIVVTNTGTSPITVAAQTSALKIARRA